MSARGIGEKKPPLQGQIQTGNRHTPPPRAVRDGPELHGVFAWSAVCGMMLYVLRGHVQGGPFYFRGEREPPMLARLSS